MRGKIEIPEGSFVVLSQQRSGTHFIQSLLNSHPNIACHGELFHFDVINRAYPQLQHLRKADSIVALALRLAKGKRNGFIVQDSQTGGSAPFGWTHDLLLQCSPPPLIIWLQRRNPLAQYASWLVALRTMRWVEHKGGSNGKKKIVDPLRPDPREAAGWMRRMRDDRLARRELLSPLASIDLFYEDLVDDPVPECQRVFAKLGLPPHRAKANTVPQRSYRLHEVFENFEEIVEAAKRLSVDSAVSGERYQFTKDYFSSRIPLWERHLASLKGKPSRAVEIGSLEGRSAVWTLTHLLTHPDARLICIDIFEKNEVERRFDHNIAATGLGHKVTKKKAESWTVLRTLQPGTFDLVYIDGNHHGMNVLEDGVLALRLLRPGGFLVFDDYQWRENPNLSVYPKDAIDPLLKCWGDAVEVVEKKEQVILRKL